MYILFAIVAIGLLILVHEAGHFLAAKLLKVPAYEFSIGFGPRIFHRKKGETAFSLRAFPLGGYVSFADPDDESTVKVFYQQPIWKRLIVILAGSFMNVLFAFVVGFGLLACAGGAQATSEIAVVQPDSPAQEAGLQVGDTILTANGVAVPKDDISVLTAQMQAAQGSEVVLTVNRDGQQLTVLVTPRYDEEQQAYLVGINLSTKNVPLPLGQAVKYAALNVTQSISAMVQFLQGLFTRGEGADQVGSVVGAVSQMAQYGNQYGFATFLSTVIFLSINLAVINMLPLPALDGLKAVLLGVEAIRKKPLPPEKEGVVQVIGLIVFALLFVVLCYRDIARLITGG
ncbi:MAG: M50 family metallopeptidase [Eubacteriales bacterium]|nr:M50 family metallopeptidase [Eubacteriales bacterium]